MAAFHALPGHALFGEGGARFSRQAGAGNRVPAEPPPEPVAPLLSGMRGLDRPPNGKLRSGAVKPLEPCFALPVPRWKRAMDVGGALAALVLAAPVMGAVALAIKLTSPGPVLFRQWRGGRGGRPFLLYKFRTMAPDAEARKEDLRHLNERRGPAFKMKNDPRVTRVGRLLRTLSLDELPQLYNVLRGDMSLVGPRPLPLPETGEMAAWQRMRLQVKPGITGLWQVTRRNRSCFDEWVRLDIQYIQQRSFWLDCKILLKTIPAVLSCKGAH